MNEISSRKELEEVKNSISEGFKNIKPESNISVNDARNIIDDLFKKSDTSDYKSKDIQEEISKEIKNYFKDLKDKSECPETIPNNPFDVADLVKRTPEDNAEKREEFSEIKSELKSEWEIANGRSWPKYDHDIYSSNGKLIRKAGSDYDAHHIHPLGMGGKNVASNITPLSAEVHYDKQGVHAPDSPYSKLDKYLGGID